MAPGFFYRETMFHRNDAVPTYFRDQSRMQTLEIK
nr:MAG TPA: hypothetical protein [Caudoviricetes sp.]